MKAPWLLFCFAFIIYIQANATIIRGQIVATGMPLPKTISLFRYYPSGPPDTAVVGAYGDFTFSLSPNIATLYRIEVGRSMVDVVVNPKEEVVRVNVDLRAMANSTITIEESKENDAYDELKKSTSAYHEILVDAVKASANDSTLWKLINKRNNELERFEKLYAGTFTAEKIVPALKLKIDKEFNAAQNLQFNFLAGIDFGDTAILVTPHLNELLIVYTKYLGDTSEGGTDKFIQELIVASKKNVKVYRHVTTALFNMLYRNNNERMLLAYVRRFATHPDDTLPPVVKMKMETLRKVMPGQKLVDLQFKNLKGQEEKLSDVAAQNNLTLLVIWESDCPHCRDAMPEIKKLYDTYRPKGFEVFGVSMDREEAPWKTYLQESNITWHNVRMAEGEQQSIEDYYVTFTPTMVLIDKNGIIWHRLVNLELLKQFLSEGLK